MSNKSINNSATNGRNSAKLPTATIHKPTTTKMTSIGQQSQSQKHSTTTATATSTVLNSKTIKKLTITLPEKNSTTANSNIKIKTNNTNESNKTAVTLNPKVLSNNSGAKPGTIVHNTATISPSPTTAASTHRRDNSSLIGGAGLNCGQIIRDERLFQYGQPQKPLEKIRLRKASDATDGNESSPSSTEAESASLSLNSDADADVDPNKTLIYYEGNLIAGSLDALIQHMVPTSEYYPEHSYSFSFLLSARLFIRPHELLAKISQTWEQQQSVAATTSTSSHSATTTNTSTNPSVIGMDVVDEAHFGQIAVVASASPLAQRKIVAGSGTNKDSIAIANKNSSCVNLQGAGPIPLAADGTHLKMPRTPIQKSAQNCIRLLSEWIETFPYDFRDERLMQQVRILARKCVYIDNSLGKQVSRILQMLVQRLTSLEKYEEFLQTLISADPNASIAANNAKENTQSQHHSSSQQQHHVHFSTSASAAFAASSNSSGGSSSNFHHQPILSHHLHNATASHATHNSLGKSMIAALNTATHHDQHHKLLQMATAAASSGNDGSPSPHDVVGIMDICGNCEQLAHQLTAIELERLSHIGPEEFVQAFAKDYHQRNRSNSSSSNSNNNSKNGSSTSSNASSSDTTLSDMKKTRNLESYVEWFNRLSYLVSSEIVKYPKKKQRVRIIEYWIETARECFNIGNFNSLMAIIAGLNLEPISRLKKTWAKVQLAKFSVLEHQMDPTANFNSYRSTLKAAMWRFDGATDEREKIIIPFFSLFVKDLYFLNEGCSNRLPNDNINFEKCSQLAKQIMEFNEWKKVSCPFEIMPNVITYLQTSSILNENTLSMASFECEPPENNEEKGRYKTVKAETKQQLLQQLQDQQLHQQQTLQH